MRAKFTLTFRPAKITINDTERDARLGLPSSGGRLAGGVDSGAEGREQAFQAVGGVAFGGQALAELLDGGFGGLEAPGEPAEFGGGGVGFGAQPVAVGGGVGEPGAQVVSLAAQVPELAVCLGGPLAGGLGFGEGALAAGGGLTGALFVGRGLLGEGVGVGLGGREGALGVGEPVGLLGACGALAVEVLAGPVEEGGEAVAVGAYGVEVGQGLVLFGA